MPVKYSNSIQSGYKCYMHFEMLYQTYCSHSYDCIINVSQVTAIPWIFLIEMLIDLNFIDESTRNVIFV